MHSAANTMRSLHVPTRIRTYHYHQINMICAFVSDVLVVRIKVMNKPINSEVLIVINGSHSFY